MGTGRDAAADRARAAEATDPADLRRLDGHQRWDVRRAVALNPACPPAVLQRLGSDKVWAVRAGVAAAPQAPADLLLRLAASGREVRPVGLALAGNPSATVEVIAALMASRDDFVGGKAAGHPAASADLLARYADGLGRPAWALKRIAGNANCPPELAEKIRTGLASGAQDGDPNFDPDDCQSHPGTPGNAHMTAYAWYVQQATTVDDPHLHPLWRVREQIAYNHSQIPEAWLPILARDPRDEVRVGAAGLPGMERRFLLELAADANPAIAEAANRTLQLQATTRPHRSGVIDFIPPRVRYRLIGTAVVLFLLWIAKGR
jgi:hypothetical protein